LGDALFVYFVESELFRDVFGLLGDYDGWFVFIEDDIYVE